MLEFVEKQDGSQEADLRRLIHADTGCTGRVVGYTYVQLEHFNVTQDSLHATHDPKVSKHCGNSESCGFSRVF